MTKILFDAGENQVTACHAEILHRESLVYGLVERMRQVPAARAQLYGGYDDWYLSVLLDGLFRRVFVVEYREWNRHVEDLIRDQLSRNGMDSGLWDELRSAAGKGTYLQRVRDILAGHLEAELPDALWEDLEEIRAVAETISHGTREARESLRERFPKYFSEVDAFGDGDEIARLTLDQPHVEAAFAAVKAFWDREEGLPHREERGAA